ncbi:Kup system potassium uptake protein [hydrothermal vent metagenome]|uniref:Kup system potassium uptake protein n=1 Tax=hydrothermal vent metagenome TaxID=652676 RepID=A0A3B1B817_9ZZZZ
MTGTVTAAPSKPRVVLLSALGVVFGDIGTSPLYALRESFGGSGAPALDLPDLLGVLSLILWSLILVISIKYLVFVLRADNQGEGGIIALVALLNPWKTKPGQARYVLMIMGLFGACLLYGDGTITPAISVLSAVEGLRVAAPQLAPFIVPLTIIILLLLFMVQRRGSGKIGRLFGPIMLLWFLVLALLGLRGIILQPSVLAAFNPLYSVQFFAHNGLAGFLTLGAVFLVVTGGEALYADLGHFGVSPIRRAWFLIVFPALFLNYLGQGAMLMQHPEAIRAPFFYLAPDWASLPLVVLATVATVIASQAVISGTFSLTRQAIQLGQLPRMRVIYTQADESGQIYLPLVNWLLLVACIVLVIGFGSSDALASAYGVAVSLDMVVTTLLAIAVARRYRWRPRLALWLGAVFIIIDNLFLGANLVKIPEGGWYALLIAGLIFALMWSWRAGRALLATRLSKRAMHQDIFLRKIKTDSLYRVPGTAVVMTGHYGPCVPAALMQHVACTHVLHERVIFLTVITADQPHVPASERLDFEDLGQGVIRMRVYYGFSQPPNIPLALKLGERLGILVDTDAAIYILGHETLIARREVPGLPYWQELIFVWLARNAARATAYYHLPEDRVLELGLEVSL